MNAVEFGRGNGQKILLIPGNMMSWRQFARVIPLLERDHHVIAVSTDGYDGTSETTFTTATASAQKLERYIRGKLNGSIDLLFGESFGCATAGMLFHRRKVNVASMILSGPQNMSLGPLNGLLKAIIPLRQDQGSEEAAVAAPAVHADGRREADRAVLRRAGVHLPRNAEKCHERGTEALRGHRQL